MATSDLPPMPPPRRRVLDTVVLEGLDAFIDADAEGRELVKSRDFPELHGRDLQPGDIEIVLYDKYSTDSFAACFVASRALGERAHYIGVDRSMGVEDLLFAMDEDQLAGRNLAMLGICWSIEEMHGLVEECPWILVLENHEIAGRQLAQLSYPSLVTVIDPQMGAGAMAWNFFFPQVPVPPFIRYLEDADLGREILRDAAAFADGFGPAFSFKPQMGEILHSDEDFQTFDKFLNGTPSAIESAITEGQRLQPWIREQSREACEKCQIRFLRAFPAWRCFLLNLASPLEGRIAEQVIEEMVGRVAAENRERCFVAVFETRKRFVRVVLRSLKGGPRVDEIGFHFGGCGHARHAFFSVPLETWEDLWAPSELVLWDVPSGGPSCLKLSRGDLVTVVCTGQRFRESAFEEWSWAYKTNPDGTICTEGSADGELVEGWVPSLSHTLFLVTKSRPSTEEDGVESLEEGDLLVAWLQHGEYLYGSKCSASLTSALDAPKVWFFRDDSCLRQVHPNSIRALLAATCVEWSHGGA